ncbi:hypothetical protein L8P05_14655, partial [Enterobacter cloacae]|uniref:hypothetical protein n=1 Tax=Enterobacter cloacae TaxID=550 RepID=UPI0020040C24
CASRLLTGCEPQEISGYIHLAKSNRSYFNQFSRYKEIEFAKIFDWIAVKFISMIACTISE